MPLASEREIATGNGMWLIYPSHLEWILDCQKMIKHQGLSSRAIAKILNVVNKSSFVADATFSMRN